jgi:hypothetical protein
VNESAAANIRRGNSTAATPGMAPIPPGDNSNRDDDGRREKSARQGHEECDRHGGSSAMTFGVSPAARGRLSNAAN